MKFYFARNLYHVSCCSGTELGILGFTDEDDVTKLCKSLVVGAEYSPDENCFWPVLVCQALVDAKMLLDNESCPWSPSYYEDIPF